jgi:hypothetical protein
MVDETRQPYAYTGDDPVNAADPTGDMAMSFSALNYDLKGYHTVHLTAAADFKTQYRIEQFGQEISKFIGSPANPAHVELDFWDGVAQTLHAPEQGIKDDTAHDTWVYQGPVNIINFETGEIKPFAFLVAVGKRTNDIATIFFSTRSKYLISTDPCGD